MNLMNILLLWGRLQPTRSGDLRKLTTFRYKVKRLAEVDNIQIATALPPARHRSSLGLFEFRTVTPDEVRTIVLNSPSNKVPGHFAERHFAERHFAERHFAERTFCRRTFCRTDVLPNGHFAERAFCRTDSLPNGQLAENRDTIASKSLGLCLIS
jgi:hypothetical protein